MLSFIAESLLSTLEIFCLKKVLENLQSTTYSMKQNEKCGQKVMLNLTFDYLDLRNPKASFMMPSSSYDTNANIIGIT